MGEQTTDELRVALQEKEAELERAYRYIKELLAENEKLRAAARVLSPKEGGYPADGSWISKIVWVIGEAGRPLQSSEILTLLEVYEPSLQQKASKQKFLSAFLSLAGRRGRIAAYSLKGNRGYFYQLPNTRVPS